MVILGNSNKHFSGVTSTMLQNLSLQKKYIDIRVFGKYHIQDKSLVIGWIELIKLCHQSTVVFHARRNQEIIHALILKYIFRGHLNIILTSTAQRNHSSFTKWLMKKVDIVLSTCDAAAKYINQEVYDIVPHGIQTNIYFPAENKQQVWQSLKLGGRVGIGMFGRVRKQKGVHLFVNACIDILPEFPDVVAIIVGAINKKNRSFVVQLKQQIKQANLVHRILFLGEQPFDRIPKLMRSVSVVAALSENEGFGLTPLEALASKSAVLTTTAGAWNEVLTNNVNGYIVEVNNQEQIQQKLQHLLTNPANTQQLAESGYKKIIKDYCIEKEAHHLMKIYRDAAQI